MTITTKIATVITNDLVSEEACRKELSKLMTPSSSKDILEVIDIVLHPSQGSGLSESYVPARDAHFL